MKGAMAEPLAKMINDPNRSRVRMMGSSQYFLRVLKKPHKSRKIPIMLLSTWRYLSTVPVL